MSSPVLMMMSAAVLIMRLKNWSVNVRYMLISRNRMPYMLSLSIMSRRSRAPMAAISGMHRPEQ